MDEVTSSKLRDHLANERTFLAWIRTSIGIMAFGFVVEKFSLFLREIASFLGKSSILHLSSSSSQSYSSLFGILLVVIGAFICLLAFIKYKKIEIQINNDNYQPTRLIDLMLALTIFFVGIFLALYLIQSL